MSILRIATTEAELTTFGGVISTSSNFYDNTRVQGAFRHNELQISTLNFPAASGSETWIHFVFGIHRNTSNPQFWRDYILEVRDASNNLIYQIDVINTMELRHRVFDGSGGSAIVYSAIVSENTNFVMDIRIDVGVNVSADLYFNAALQGSANVTTAGATNPNRMTFGCQDNDTGSGTHRGVFFSEMIVADEDTRGFRLREFFPQSFGVFAQWDGTVASVADNSLATGVSTDVNNERVSFGLGNLDEVDPGDIINRVVAQSYAQRGATGLTQFQHFFRYPDTTVFAGNPAIALNTIGDWYIDEYLTNPKTAVSWVPADLAGIQLGLEALT